METLQKTLTSLLDHLLKIAATPLDGAHNLYWFFGLTFLALAAYSYLHYYAGGKGFSLKKFLKFVFPKGVYLHPSALVDYQIFVANRFVALVSRIFLSVAAALIAYHTTEWTSGLLGKAARPMESGPVAVTVVTLVAIMSTDFALFFVHMLSHRIPLLWEMHRVHHSAEVLTPITAFRHHPFYDALTGGATALTTGLAQGVLLYFFVGKVPGATLFGANLVLSLFRIFGVNLRHSHIWLSWGPVLSRIIVSPAQHQIHHSVDERHRNQNYGEVFALWDLAFGTLYVPKEREELTFGVERDAPQEHPTLLAVYFKPFAGMWRVLRGKGGDSLKASKSPSL